RGRTGVLFVPDGLVDAVADTVDLLGGAGSDLLGEVRDAVEGLVADPFGLLALQRLIDLVLVLLVGFLALVHEVFDAHGFLPCRGTPFCAHVHFYAIGRGCDRAGLASGCASSRRVPASALSFRTIIPASALSFRTTVPASAL